MHISELWPLVAAFTFGSFFLASYLAKDDLSHHGHYPIMDGLVALFWYSIWLITNLFVWLVFLIVLLVVR